MSLQPHGGTLVNRFLAADEAVCILEAAAGMPCLRVDAYTAFDIDCIAKGIFSPLTGFMGAEQTRRDQDHRDADPPHFAPPFAAAALAFAASRREIAISSGSRYRKVLARSEERRVGKECS